MSLEIKGRIIAVLEEKTGEGKNGKWQSQDAVIETDGQYPKKVCFNMFGDKIIPLSIGQEVNVFFEVESKEFNGRWFTNLRAWKVDVIGGSSVSSTQQPTATTSPSTPPPSGGGTGLPFR